MIWTNEHAGFALCVEVWKSFTWAVISHRSSQNLQPSVIIRPHALTWHTAIHWVPDNMCGSFALAIESCWDKVICITYYVHAHDCDIYCAVPFYMLYWVVLFFILRHFIHCMETFYPWYRGILFFILTHCILYIEAFIYLFGYSLHYIILLMFWDILFIILVHFVHYL